jgi:hypothetical protein
MFSLLNKNCGTILCNIKPFKQKHSFLFEAALRKTHIFLNGLFIEKYSFSIKSSNDIYLIKIEYYII